MSFMGSVNGRAGTRRPRYYAQWGLETPQRIDNGLYRGGTGRVADRYIIAPIDVPYLDQGMTVGDLAASVAFGIVGALCVLGALEAIGLGIDGWLASVGY